MKKLIALLTLIAFCAFPAFGQEYGVLYTRNAYHITTKATTHVMTKTCTFYTAIITVTGAGTSWTITLQDLSTTPKTIYTATVAAGTTVIALPVGILCTGGIDLVSAGTTAGTADVFVTAR